jgi:lipopolysaccharide export system permease protein
MTLVCYFISLYLTPLAHSKYRDSLAYYRDNFAAIYLEEGVFNNIIKNITIYLDEYQDDGSLKGILVHDQRNKNHITTIFAQSGSITKIGDFIRFTFYNGNRQEIDEHGELSILNFSNFNYDLSLKSADKQIRAKELEELKLSSLLKNKNIPILRKKKISTELNQRLCWPLYNVLLAIIALLGVLPAEFSRAGNTKRIVVNIIFAIACVLTYFITSNLTLDHLLINLMPFILVCVFIIISSYLLFKER